MNQIEPERITVLIIEDHPIFREGLRTHLETRTDLVALLADVETASEGIDLVQELVPDVVLLDLGLPETTEDGIEEGLTAIQQIRAISPGSKIIVLTAHRRREVVFQAIQAGATSYLLKEHVTGQTVINHIERVMAGDVPIDADIAKMMWDFLQSPGSELNSPIEQLTTREMDVLRLVSQNLTNRQIAEALFIEPTTVKRHVSNILSKLQLRSRLELLAYYRRQFPQE